MARRARHAADARIGLVPSADGGRFRASVSNAIWLPASLPAQPTLGWRGRPDYRSRQGFRAHPPVPAFPCGEAGGVTSRASDTPSFTSDRLERLLEIERTHFWFAGRRDLLDDLLQRAN